MRTYGIVRIAKSITLQNGVMKTTIAHNDYKKDGHFFNAVAFKGTGEVIFNNCKVGDRIFIDGEILNNNYINKDNEKVYQNQVVIRTFEFIEKKEKDSQERFTPPEITGKSTPRTGYDTIEVKEDNLPFR